MIYDLGTIVSGPQHLPPLTLVHRRNNGGKLYWEEHDFVDWETTICVTIASLIWRTFKDSPFSLPSQACTCPSFVHLVLPSYWYHFMRSPSACHRIKASLENRASFEPMLSIISLGHTNPHLSHHDQGTVATASSCPRFKISNY